MPEKFDLSDYVSVAERLEKFYAKYPEGRVQAGKPELFTVGEQAYIWCQATAWRSPDDPLPAIASAWEDWPGRTPYTKHSEMQNAETSAVGRALWMVGIEAKRGGASREEIQRSRERADAPPAAPEDWRGKFLLACQDAKVPPSEVCLRASDGSRDDITDFADVERFALAAALKALTP